MVALDSTHSSQNLTGTGEIGQVSLSNRHHETSEADVVNPGDKAAESRQISNGADDKHTGDVPGDASSDVSSNVSTSRVPRPSTPRSQFQDEGTTSEIGSQHYDYGSKSQIGSAEVDKSTSGSIILTPMPNRPAYHQLKPEFTPPTNQYQAQEQVRGISDDDDCRYKSEDSSEPNFLVSTTPTPLGFLQSPKSPNCDSTTGSSPIFSLSLTPNLSPRVLPKSPRLDPETIYSSSGSKPDKLSNLSPTNLTPITSNEEFVIYSDSDNASQSSVDLRDKPRRKLKRDESTPTTKPKRRLRRKSNKSDSTSITMGTGYTSIPGTGKIFRNLLILEESLRQQVIQQRALRRKYLIFLMVLFSLIFTVSYHLFITDSKSTGIRRVLLQLTLLALLMTLFLYHLSGEYQKTIVLPRKFLSTTNKGLRQLNIRLVKIVNPWTDSFTDIIREILLNIIGGCLNAFHKVSEKSIKNKNSKIEVFLVSCQSQCQPRIGVTDVKLVLNTRVFNTDIREGWELYRSEFWINEGVRRRQQMLAFITDEPSKETKEVLARSKLLKKDKKERRERRRSNPPKLNELNLESLSSGLALNESIAE
jgi:hypothetical protein